MALSFQELKDRARAEHRPWGDPCRRKGCGLPKLRHYVSHTFLGERAGACTRAGCGLPFENHYQRYGGQNKRYRSLALVPPQGKEDKGTPFYPVGVDGEGFGHGDGVDHRYTLLGARCAAPKENESRVRRYIEIGDDGHTYDELGDRITKAPRLDKDGRPLGLRTADCLDFFLAMPLKSKCFGFSFGYDLSMMLRDVDPRRLFLLTHPELRARPVQHKSGAPTPVRWQDPLQSKSAPPYFLNLQGRRFSVARKNARGVLRRTVVWDIFAFFGKSFVDVLDIENIGTPEHRASIREMKLARDSFGPGDRERVRSYCLDECRDTAEIVERLIASHEQVGLHLRHFYGPGSSADAMLNQMGIRQALGRVEKTVPGNLRKLERQLVKEYKKKGYSFSLPRRIEEVDQERRRDAQRAMLPEGRRPKDYWSLQLMKLGVQRFLVPAVDAQRILSVAETGESDPATVHALQQFQIQHQLPATGAIDVETSAALLYFRHKYESTVRRETDLRVKREFNEQLGTMRQKHLADVITRTVEEKIEFEQRKRVRGPEKMQSAVMAAFFGGRFEHAVMGVVEPDRGDAGPDRRRGIWSYDLSQAYPAALLSLPCLLHATWTFTMDEALFKKADHALVRYALGPAPKDMLWAPLPYRTDGGSHVYPARSGGGWVYAREFRAAERIWNAMAPGYVQFKGAWIYERACDCPNPFTVGGISGTGVVGYYLERLRFGKDARGLTIKGGLNSCFGKLCQAAGKDPIYQSYLWAGMITAHCRARILELMGIHRDMRNVLAIATDGVLSLEYFNDDRLPPPDASPTGEGSLSPEVREAIAERNQKEIETAAREGRRARVELFHRPLGGWERRRIGTEKEPKALFLMKPGVYFPLNPSASDMDEMRARGFGRARLVSAAVNREADAKKSGGDLLVDAWTACPRDDLKDADGVHYVTVALPARKTFHGIRASIREVPCTPEEADTKIDNRRVAFKYAVPNTPGAQPLPGNPRIWAMHDGSHFEIQLVDEDDPRPSHAVPIHLKYVASEKFLSWTLDEVHESFAPLPKRAAVVRSGKSAILPLRSADSGRPEDDELRWRSQSYQPNIGARKAEDRMRALTQKQYYLDARDSADEEAEVVANEGVSE